MFAPKDNTDFWAFHLVIQGNVRKLPIEHPVERLDHIVRNVAADCVVHDPFTLNRLFQYAPKLRIIFEK